MEKYGHGKNHLILGCMFGSKTTHLQEVVEKTRHCPSILTLVLSAGKDTRWSGPVFGRSEIQSHAGRLLEADARVENGEEAIAYVLDRCRKDLIARPKKKGMWRVVVVLDECQFVPGVACFAQWVLDHRQDLPSVHVEAHYAGLDGSSDRKMFAPVVELLPYCDTLVKLAAVCMCCQQSRAAFTRRDVAVQGEFFLGSEESYSAVCGLCHTHSKGSCPFYATSPTTTESTFP